MTDLAGAVLDQVAAHVETLMPDYTYLQQAHPTTLGHLGYRPVFEHHGLGDLARRLSELARAQRWEEIPLLISDEILHTFAVVGTFGEIVELMHKRCAGLASSTEFSIPVTSKTEYERLVGLIKTLQQG